MKKYILLFSIVCINQLIFAQCNEPVHSNNPSDNWLSCNIKANPNNARADGHWIQYDLGYIYPITTSHIWNYNVLGETTKGFKEVVIDFSIDGNTWTQLGIYTFSEATGSNSYVGFEGPDFNDIDARYILITALTNYGDASCYGLAECKFNLAQDVVIGIQEITDNIDFEIYPNPTQNSINFSYSNLDIKEIILINSAGFELQRYTSNIQKTYDVSYLPNGTYFIVANTIDNKFVVRKFVKIN